MSNNATIRGLLAMGRLSTFCVLAVLLSVVVSGSVFAEDKLEQALLVSESDTQASDKETADEKSVVSSSSRDAFVNQDAGFRLERAGGWLAGVPSQGSVALFRAAGDSQAQIELRVSKDIGVEGRDAYISTFQNSLLRVGFVQVEVRERTNYGGRIGSEYEYRVLSDGREFRLITWLYGRDSEVWIASGFFPLPRRDMYFRSFQKMMRSLEFTDSNQAEN